MIERFGGFGNSAPADRKFHEARWQREAEKLNSSLVAGMLIKIGVKGATAAEDVMYAEAVHDDEQFDRLASQEHQHWDEMLHEVINDMRAVRDNSPDKPKDFKLVQLMLGTGLGSAACTGQNMALEDMGYADLPSVVIGSSGASGPAPFFVAHQSRRGASLFMNECTSKEFLDFTPVPKLDTEVIARNMEQKGGPKSLDQEAIRNSNTEVFAIAANKQTHQAEFLDFKEMDNMIDACRASSAIPFFRDAVEIDGTHYYDGAFAPIPFEELIAKFKPTHLLIQPNVAFNYLQSYQYTGAERAVLWATTKLGSMASMGTVQEYFRMKENVRGLLETIGKIHNVKIAVMWPPDEGLGALVNDRDTMRRGILESYRKTISDFGAKQPQRIGFLPGDIPETEQEEFSKAA